ncbi:hypothetical protein CHUAL_006324 [Chamberlinius hualienensis]
MNKLAIVVLIFAAVSVQNCLGKAVEIPWSAYYKFSCTNRRPGFYADKNKACEVFYRCVKDDPRTFTFSCGPGTKFNEKINACDWPQNVDCY